MASSALDQQARTRLRLWLQTTGITQVELAARIGRTQVWISRYLKAEFNADLETLHRMAGAFGHTLTELLDLPQDATESKLLEAYRAMPPKLRADFLRLFESLVSGRRAGPR
jgi:transcriptional regulator with XRE-family HTH domain